VRRLATGLTLTLVYGGVLFALAGRLDLPLLWIFWSIGAAAIVAGAVTIPAAVVQEQMRPAAGGADRGRRIAVLVLANGVGLVGALDVGRLHWSDTVPHTLQIAALLAYASGIGFLVWAMAVNRFFSPVVRVQAEGGHQLVTAGPYGLVRHPGYLGMVFGYGASGLALGSWWAFLPAAACALLILRRAALEDRYLQEHLAGYREYSRRVPYRVFPGLW